MYLLDTDKMTLLEQANPESVRLRNRTAAIPPGDLATLLTRNLSDFGKVPDLIAEDWTF